MLTLPTLRAVRNIFLLFRSLWWCKKQWAKWAKIAALATGLLHAGLGEARTAELWCVPEEDGNPNYQIKLSNFTLFVCLLCVYDEAGGAC